MSPSPASGKLIVVSAPSGAGKTTLCRRLLEDFPGLRLSVSSTTRPPRGTEQQGREYFFLTREEFEDKIRRNGFAEWAQVHGNYYGTSLETLERAWESGKAVLLDIDVQGAASLRKLYGKDCVTVFIAPPSFEELERRLRARGTDAEPVIRKRLENAREEMGRAREFDHVVVNQDLDSAYEQLKALVTQALGPGWKKN